MLGAEHPDTRLSLNILQGIYYSQQRYEEAEPISKQALAISSKVLGEEHPDTLVDMHNLATIYDKLGRYTEAEPIYLTAIAGKRRVLGTVHQTTVNGVLRLAAMYQRQQRFAEAESQLTEVFRALETTPGGSSSTKNAVLTQLGQLYDAWNKPAKAAEFRAKLSK